MTQNFTEWTPGTITVAGKLLARGAVYIGPDAIKVSNEAGFLAANGFARKDGPDLVLLDGETLEEVLRAQLEQNSAAQQTAD